MPEISEPRLGYCAAVLRNNGKPRSWYRDVPEDDLEAELSYLRKDIFQRDVDLAVVRITAFDRFSNRV